MGKLRRALAALSLLVLAVSLASPLSPEETRDRLSRVVAALTGAPEYRSEAMGFWFDPDYAAFLEDVRRLTPENSTIALFVPPAPDVYFDQAVYRLSPRRIVSKEREGEARYVAAYRVETPAGEEGLAVAHGRLWKR